MFPLDNVITNSQTIVLRMCSPMSQTVWRCSSTKQEDSNKFALVSTLWLLGHGTYKVHDKVAHDNPWWATLPWRKTPLAKGIQCNLHSQIRLIAADTWCEMYDPYSHISLMGSPSYRRLMLCLWYKGPVSLRLMTSQFKDIVTRTQK